MDDIDIYEADNGTIEVRSLEDSIWQSQEQMYPLFDVQKAAISKHFKNIFADGKLARAATVS